jgi:hypothetical protein
MLSNTDVLLILLGVVMLAVGVVWLVHGVIGLRDEYRSRRDTGHCDHISSDEHSHI